MPGSSIPSTGSLQPLEAYTSIENMLDPALSSEENSFQEQDTPVQAENSLESHSETQRTISPADLVDKTVKCSKRRHKPTTKMIDYMQNIPGKTSTRGRKTTTSSRPCTRAASKTLPQPSQQNKRSKRTTTQVATKPSIAQVDSDDDAYQRSSGTDSEASLSNGSDSDSEYRIDEDEDENTNSEDEEEEGEIGSEGEEEDEPRSATTRNKAGGHSPQHTAPITQYIA